ADRTPVHNKVDRTAKSRSGQGLRAFRLPAATVRSNRSGVSSPCSGLGTGGGVRGFGTTCMGLPPTAPSTTKNPKKPFHVDQARVTVDADRLAANRANADRSTEGVRSPTGSWPAS